MRAILELVAAITRIFNITDEEVLEAVINESDELAHICELYKYKMVNEELPKLKCSKIMSFHVNSE